MTDYPREITAAVNSPMGLDTGWMARGTFDSPESLDCVEVWLPTPTPYVDAERPSSTDVDDALFARLKEVRRGE